MVLTVDLEGHSYDIVIENGVLERAGQELNLKRKVLIVTDDGVPAEYSRRVAQMCDVPVIEVIKSGEQNKSLSTFSHLQSVMLANKFSRKDAVVAVGGGVVGDLSGFAASCYMRGIDFYNIPTTLLSQVDSSVGGKTAVNHDGIKNVVGTFYQPKKVLIDSATLSTLPKRQISNGMAEAIKMAVTLDGEFFEMLESADIGTDIDEIIQRAVSNKRSIVEQDEKEAGLRRVLNFGHTIGHGIEVSTDLYHGESVALGMLPLCSVQVRSRLKKVLEKAGLPTEYDIDIKQVMEAAKHDKKADSDTVTVVKTDAVGSFCFEKTTYNELEKYVKEVF